MTRRTTASDTSAQPTSSPAEQPAAPETVTVTREAWDRMRQLAELGQQAKPLNLADPAVQKRLAAQWGYVPAPAQQAKSKQQAAASPSQAPEPEPAQRSGLEEPAADLAPAPTVEAAPFTIMQGYILALRRPRHTHRA